MIAETRGADATRTRRLRPAPVTRGERRERLKAILAIPDVSERHGELITYLDGLPPGLIEETLNNLMDLPQDDGALRLTLSAWAKVDPPAALAFTLARADGSPGGGHEELILRDWGAMDPQAAMKWAAARSSPEQEASVGAVIAGAARGSIEELPKVIENIADADLDETAFDIVAREFKDQPEMIERIMASATESQRAMILGSMSWQMKDWVRGAEILNEHPEAIRHSVPESIHRQWVHHDFAAATAAVAAMPSGELKEKAAAGIIEGAAYRDIGKALELMDRYPESITEQLRVTMIGLIGKSDPEQAMAQTPMLSNEDQRNSVVVGQLKSWLKEDPAAAREWMDTHPQPAAVLELLPPQP